MPLPTPEPTPEATPKPTIESTTVTKPKIVARGTCGSRVTWSLEDSALTIYGNGEMFDYSFGQSIPWFGYLDQIQSLIIESGVTSIGENAFRGCKNLTNVTIPESVSFIGEYAFAGCSSLTYVSIPRSVKEIHSYAFYGCKSITEITIPDGVTKICGDAFSGCSSLTNLTIPNSVTEIWKAFEGCDELKTVYYAGSSGQWHKIKGYENVPGSVYYGS